MSYYVQVEPGNPLRLIKVERDVPEPGDGAVFVVTFVFCLIIGAGVGANWLLGAVAGWIAAVMMTAAIATTIIAFLPKREYATDPQPAQEELAAAVAQLVGERRPIPLKVARHVLAQARDEDKRRDAATVTDEAAAKRAERESAAVRERRANRDRQAWVNHILDDAAQSKNAVAPVLIAAEKALRSQGRHTDAQVAAEAAAAVHGWSIPVQEEARGVAVAICDVVAALSGLPKKARKEPFGPEGRTPQQEANDGIDAAVATLRARASEAHEPEVTRLRIARTYLDRLKARTDDSGL